MSSIAFFLRSLLLYTLDEEKANTNLPMDSNRIDKRSLFLYQAELRDFGSDDSIDLVRYPVARTLVLGPNWSIGVTQLLCSITLLDRVEMLAWNVNSKRPLRNATAPMNRARGKACAVSV